VWKVAAALSLALVVVGVPVASSGASGSTASQVLAEDIATTHRDITDFIAKLRAELSEEGEPSFPNTLSDQAAALLPPLDEEQAALLSTSFSGKLRADAVPDALVLTKLVWLMGLSWEAAHNSKMYDWELDLQGYLNTYDAATAKVTADLSQ
jgi:hypothetical protein